MSMPPLAHPPRHVVRACLVAAACAVAAPAAHAEFWSHWTEVKGSGRMVHSALPVAGGAIAGLTLHTGAAVRIRQGERDAVEIDADDNVLPLIDVHRDGSTLVVEDKSHFSSDKARITVTVQHLVALSGSGSSSIVADGLISPELALHLGGSSDLRLNDVKAERIVLTTGGSSEVTLQGICNDLALNLGGSTEIKAAKLEARNVTLSAGGSSEVTVWAKVALTGSMGGSSELRYYGVKQATLATGGSSSVQRLGDAP